MSVSPTWERDKRSGMVLDLPGICLAENRMLCVRVATTRALTKDMIRGSLEVWLLMIGTIA